MLKTVLKSRSDIFLKLKRVVFLVKRMRFTRSKQHVLIMMWLACSGWREGGRVKRVVCLCRRGRRGVSGC